MRRVLFIFLLVGILASVFALDYVDPNPKEDCLLKLIPGESYNVLFLSKLNGTELDITNLTCETCGKIVKNGPYYSFKFNAEKEGVYKLFIDYAVDGHNSTEEQTVFVSNTFINSQIFFVRDLEYYEETPIKFVITNDSDKNVSVKVSSSLPEDSFNTLEIIIPAQSGQEIETNIIPMKKGLQELSFNIKYGDYTQEIKKTVEVHYSLKHLFQENLHSYSLLASQLNLFSALRSIISFSG